MCKEFILKYLRPNYLSIIRLIGAGCLPFAYLSHKHAAFYIFFIASITDALDGHIARKYNITSAFGSLLDSFSDKMLFISAGICLLHAHPTTEYLIIIHVMFFRELCIFILRLYANTLNITLSVSIYSKIKTILQCLVFLILFFHIGIISDEIIYSSKVLKLLYIPLIFSLLSGLEYIYIILKAMNKA